MKSGTRLDSVVFQLTPTRTRCDLIITANGKSEKLTSGLLNPFLAHLKTAQDQIDKGGYSIVLEPHTNGNAPWFTKGTVERFVRFVSNPEVLERVYTIESEILQIEEAIAIQSNNEIGMTNVQDRTEKSVESCEASKPVLGDDEEKAIVLYEPGVHPRESNGPISKEGNSKVQLLRVLETRKTVLQKEQGMAFARAKAAGFDIDHIAPLISFSELFGASRLMGACLRFMDLWKRKHETGQWLEIEAAEGISSLPDLTSINASGITFANANDKQKEYIEGRPESCNSSGPDNNERTSTDAGVDQKAYVPSGNQEYMQGQFPHPMFPSWPVHSPPGTVPVYQAYPMQGIPYYQNYPGHGPYFQPPQQTENPRSNADRKNRRRRNSMDSMESHSGSENDLEPSGKVLKGLEQMKRASRSGKKHSGVVVIRNINYVTSKKQNSSGSESQSDSGAETDGDLESQDVDAQIRSKSSLRSSKRRGSSKKAEDTRNSYENENLISKKDADDAQWSTFQNYLLRDADEDKLTNNGMLMLEKDIPVKRREDMAGDDLLVLGGRNPGEMGGGKSDFQSISGNVVHVPNALKDEIFLSGRDGYSGNIRGSMDGQVQFTDIESRGGVYRRAATDDFMIHRREHPSDLAGSSSELLSVNGFVGTTSKVDGSFSHALADESFIVPSRSGLLGQLGYDHRAAIDIDSELPSQLTRTEELSNGARSQVIYEPDDLGLMPERGLEKTSIGYDPALDYESQVHDAAAVNKIEEVVAAESSGAKKLDRSKGTPEDRRKLLGVKKGKPKLSPLDEARARAERLRSFKADLQKVKKEKEEEAIKRLEALKLERQKRIAARNSCNPASSPLSSGKKLPTKHSPSMQKGSKFSDSQPGPLSPLQRAPKKTLSSGSGYSPKSSKPRNSNIGSHLADNRLSRSVSSLPDSKKESRNVTPDPKASMARIRRLSEPKVSSSHHVPASKLRNSETVSKPKPSDGPEKKKISAIINLDKTKAAALPELKIRTPKGALDEFQSIPAATESMQEINVAHSMTPKLSNPSTSKDDISNLDDMDDKPVIEKTVVMLECEQTSTPDLGSSQTVPGVVKGHFDDYEAPEKADIVPEYGPIRATDSHLEMGGNYRGPIVHCTPDQPISNQGLEESLKLSSTDDAEQPYQAPFARNSSIEDPCTGNSEYARAPPVNFEISTATDTSKVLVSDFKNLKLEKIPETLEKSPVKESSKGFRRLLKLGRKNHSSAGSEHLSESETVRVVGSEAGDHAANAAAASEVHTLKNLISQDEIASGSTTQKSSRPFSLLSPFRSKSGEKKLTA